MLSAGDVISYLDMCQTEGVNLQRGMNYRLGKNYSVILMSIRRNAPYADRIEDGGRVLIYEGHDVPKRSPDENPKLIDQPMHTPKGKLTQNGLFYKAASKYKKGNSEVEIVKVYEKIRSGIWVYNGIFKLIDAWIETINTRKVFKFKLMMNQTEDLRTTETFDIVQSRMIPSPIKLQVWKRDKGKCRICGATDNLHFDHIIPFSKGGSSLVAENIQLLCARHNLEKRNKIE
jgi:hypothetical protein